MDGYYGMYSLGVEAFPRLVARLKQLSIELQAGHFAADVLKTDDGAVIELPQRAPLKMDETSMKWSVVN